MSGTQQTIVWCVGIIVAGLVAMVWLAGLTGRGRDKK